MAGVTAAGAVSKADDGTWTFQCPGFDDDFCGNFRGDRDDEEASPFRSDNWPTKAIAVDRGNEHFGEHILSAQIKEGRKAARAEGMEFDHEAFIEAHELNRMSELAVFMAKHGLAVEVTEGDAKNRVLVTDLTPAASKDA